MTSTKLSGLVVVVMDWTDRALDSVFDGVRESFVVTVTSLSVTSTVTGGVRKVLRSSSVDVKTLTSTTALLSEFLSEAYDKMKKKKPSPSDLVKLVILSSEKHM